MHGGIPLRTSRARARPSSGICQRLDRRHHDRAAANGARVRSLGLTAIDEGPPHNFPGADAAIMDLFRPVAPGLAEASIAPGENPLVPRVFGTDLGWSYEHSDGRLYFHFGDTAFTPIEGFDPNSGQTLNDDVLASTNQTKEPTPGRCIDLAIPSLARDSGEFAPITLNGYAKEGGAFSAPQRCPGPASAPANSCSRPRRKGRSASAPSRKRATIAPRSAASKAMSARRCSRRNSASATSANVCRMPTRRARCASVRPRSSSNRARPTTSRLKSASTSLRPRCSTLIEATSAS